MAGAKARIGPHRVALDISRLAPEQVQQPHLTALGDLAAQDWLDRAQHLVPP